MEGVGSLRGLPPPAKTYFCNYGDSFLKRPFEKYDRSDRDGIPSKFGIFDAGLRHFILLVYRAAGQ